MTVGRIKTYSADTGYVWEYYFTEQNVPPSAAGQIFVFQVARDRTNFSRVEVVLERAALTAWTGAHGRELSGAERFAAAKLRLMAAFDEGVPPASVSVTPENIEELLAPLDLD